MSVIITCDHADFTKGFCDGVILQRPKHLEFEWDEKKRKKTITERDVDILHAAGIFEGKVLTRVDDRASYGEERLISLGMVGDECFVVVHTRETELLG